MHRIIFFLLIVLVSGLESPRQMNPSKEMLENTFIGARNDPPKEMLENTFTRSWTGPTVINNGIRNSSYPIAYDQQNNIIVTGFNNLITLYSIDGNKIREFEVVSVIVSLDLKFNNKIVMTTKPGNSIYEYDYEGTLTHSTVMGGYNRGWSQILVNQNTGSFYVVYDSGWTFIVYSFNPDYTLITQRFIDKPDTGWAGFNIGELTGNILFSSYQYIQTFNRYLNTVIDANVTDDQVFPMTTLLEPSVDFMYYLKRDRIFIFDMKTQNMISNTSVHLYFDSEAMIWHNRNCIVTICTYSKNDKNIPYILFFASDGSIVDSINFENDTLSAFYNVFAFVNQNTGTVVANINSQIKIWKLEN